MILSLFSTSQYFSMCYKNQKGNTHSFILAGPGVVLLPSVSSASVVQRSASCCLTDFSPERAWVCSAPPRSPLVMEKGHLYLEVANQPGNHHAEIAPMKIKQCYI